MKLFDPFAWLYAATRAKAKAVRAQALADGVTEADLEWANALAGAIGVDPPRLAGPEPVPAVADRTEEPEDRVPATKPKRK